MTETRETKRIDQIEPGDVLIDYDDGTLDDEFLTVRCAEPITADPGRYHVVFVGGSYSSVRGTTEVRLATTAEIEQHEAMRRNDEKRISLRAGLMRIVDLLDTDLPVPAAIGIDMRLFATAADVHAWAAALNTEADDKTTEHGHSVAVRRHALAGTKNRTLPDVEVEIWHLGDRPAVET